MSELKLHVEERTRTGSGPSRRMRAAGRVPAVVYGGDRETVPIQVDRRRLGDLLRAAASEHAVFLLELGESGESRHTMIREMQVDPISREIVHVDFLRVNLDEKVRVGVEVKLLGTPEGVKNEGGVLDFVMREVEVECLPSDIPSFLELDVSELHLGQHIEVGALTSPAGVTIVEEAERVVASVVHPKIVEEEPEEEEELLEAELEEPEVIGRGKAADEDEEGEVPVEGEDEDQS